MLRPRNGESHASVILPTLGRNMLRPYKWFCASPINKIIVEPFEILRELAGSIGLQTKPNPFHLVTNYALKLSWTRDLFDRLIIAEAAIHKDFLLTSDRKILQHYPYAVW